MFRKFAYASALIGLGAYLWMGTSAGSYARTAYARSKAYVLGQVPVEFELERARNLLADLEPEIGDAKRAIVNEDVKLARLRKEITKTETNLEGEKVAIRSLREKLNQNLAKYEIGAAIYNKAAVERELNRRFSSFKHAEEMLKAKKEILGSRELALGAAREKHDKMAEARGQLETKLAALEARQKMIAVKKMACEIVVDDSQLADLTKLMDDINDRLDVEARISEEDGVLEKQIPASAPVVDISEQIDSYFGKTETKTGGQL